MSKQSTIPEIMQRLGKAKAAKSAAYDQFVDLRDRETELKDELHTKLSEIGLKSAKSEDGRFSASVTTKPVVRVVNDGKAAEYVKSSGLDQAVYIGLNRTAYKQLAEEQLKSSGEVLPGAQVDTSEYLSFRENKPKEAKK